jgi:uncharacterized membrane protein
MDNLKKHFAVAAVQVSPPAGVTVWLTLGNHLDAWIKLATLIYLIGQIGFLAVRAWLTVTRRMRDGDGEV